MNELISTAHKTFLNFTHAKRRECFKDFTEGQKEAFAIIPYLLHTSEPKRFGYIRGELAPCGIHGFRYHESVKKIGRKHFSSKDKFDDPKVFEGAPIESLSIMGSAGSIAQTEGSDLDYWVTISPNIRGDKLKLLQAKLTAIETWCWETLEAEVHFFTSTAQAVRDNQFGSVDKESCGTALGKLLKEEYYRTSLHVMGKIPVWWLVPYNGNEQAYKNTLQHLSAQADIEAKDVIDFGNIRTIPTDEFVGGGMWQLNKGVGSPFKSALKMGLLVEYADTSAPRDLLAQMLKLRMLENPGDMDQLDPYRMMVERVLAFFGQDQIPGAVKLLQVCMFIKMDVKVAHFFRAKNPPQHRTPRTLFEMVQSWGWDERETRKWEEFKYLSMAELSKFKRDLENFMFKALQQLREGSEEQRAVSPEDFKKMTQRLATIFNPDPKRIEWFYPPYDKMIRARIYSIQEEKSEHQWVWNLYTGVIDAEGQLSNSSAKKQLRSSHSLPDLVTWMCFNHLVKDDGKIFIQHRRDIPFSGNLKRLASAYKEHIGKPKLPTLDSDVFAQDAKPTKWLIVVNLVPIINVDELEDSEEDEAEGFQRQQAKSLIAGELAEALTEAGYTDKATEMKDITQQDVEDEEALVMGDKHIPLRAGRLPVDEDPFNAGDDGCSIFHELFVIELNSWGEVFTHHLNGQIPVAEAICTLIRQQQKLGSPIDIKVELGFGPYHQRVVRDRFVNMMERTANQMLTSTRDSSATIFQIDGHYIAILKTPHSVIQQHYRSFSEAVQMVNLKAVGSLDIFFDEDHPRLAQHADIYSQAKQGENLVHLMESGEGIMLILVDQAGRYLFNAMTKKDFAIQWGPFLLSVLSAVKQENNKGKLVIVRRKEGQCIDITKPTLVKFLELRKALPRTQMKLKAVDAQRWMEQKSVQAVDDELNEALKVHGQKGDFIVSSVLVEDKLKSNVDWTPCLALMLRQNLIRSGRRQQRQNKP